jgi:hypothetical protein
MDDLDSLLSKFQAELKNEYFNFKDELNHSDPDLNKKIDDLEQNGKPLNAEDYSSLSEKLKQTVSEFNTKLKDFFDDQNVKVNTRKLKYDESKKRFYKDTKVFSDKKSPGYVLAYIYRRRAFIQLFDTYNDTMHTIIHNNSINPSIKTNFIKECKRIISNGLFPTDGTVRVSGGKKRATKKYRKKNRKTRSKK